MNDFHSTMSRRTFMKSLGLTGAGLGAAGMAAPAFHDLDELISSEGAGWKRPWWVNEREIGDMTTEMDWSVYKRFDKYSYSTIPAINKKSG